MAPAPPPFGWTVSSRSPNLAVPPRTSTARFPGVGDAIGLRLVVAPLERGQGHPCHRQTAEHRRDPLRRAARLRNADDQLMPPIRWEPKVQRAPRSLPAETPTPYAECPK